MLLPHQVIPFLMHEDRIVREQARRYFSDSYDVGPLTADHYWQAIDRFGQTDESLSFASDLDDLPQTDASLRRLLEVLSPDTPELFEFHYQHVARNMDMPILLRHRDELLACKQLLPHVRKHIETRIRLLEEPAVKAWEQLMQHGRELKDQYADGFNASLGDALIEAAARGGEPVFEQAMRTLYDESAAEDWREIFAVRVLGMARYGPAIGPLVEKLEIDADVLREDVNRALARIGTNEVIDRIVAFYPGKPWHVRLYAHTPIHTIKRPESEAGLLKLLGMELATHLEPAYEDEEGDSLIDSLLIDLTEIGSLAGLDESRKMISEYPDDLEVDDLRQCLLATAIMNHLELPEQAEWRQYIEDLEKRLLSGSKEFANYGRELRRNWRETGISFPPDRYAHEERQQHAALSPMGDPITFSGNFSQPVETIRNTGPKIGRNDPCPCGSGKKYKRCCWKP